MSKKRSNFDYPAFDFSDFFTAIGSATFAGVVFSIWLTGLMLHVAYNGYLGYKSSSIAIERHQEWHEMCLREPRLREEQFDKCLNARIEKDLSVTWTTVNFVLHHTNICVVTSCYSVFMDLVNNLGWLLIGVALVAAIIFWISMRHGPQSRQYIREQQPVQVIDLNDRNRLVEIKAD